MSDFIEVNEKLFQIKNLDCSQTPQNIPEIYQESNNFVFSCESDCTSFLESEIYGTDTYRDDSSICKAALHSG